MNNFQPNSKLLQRLLAKRTASHNEILSEMQSIFKEINGNIEKSIRTEGENLQEFLNSVQLQVANNLAAFKSLPMNENVLNVEKAEKFMKTLMKINNLRTKKIQEYIIFLIRLEHDRSEKFKLVYRESYLKLLDVSHLLPFELQSYFQSELLRFNQITLNNFRCYYDLEHSLKLQIENDIISWSQEIKMIQIETREHIELEDKRVNEVLQKTARELLIENLMEYLAVIKIKTNDIEILCRNLVNAAKLVITNIYCQTLENQDKIFEEVLKLRFITKSSLIEQEINFHINTKEELENFEDECNASISKMKTDIKSIEDFLKTACLLWKNHFQRVSLIESLVLQDLKNVIKKNSSKTNVIQIKLTLALDKLRQESSKSKLEKSFASSKKVLNQLKTNYLKNFGLEMKVVQKYRTFREAEAEVLLSEIEYFLSDYPNPKFDVDLKDSRIDFFSEDLSFSIHSEDSKLPAFIYYLTFRVDALVNWKFGVLEALKSYSQIFKKKMDTDIEEWISHRENFAKKKLDFLLKFNEDKVNIVYVSFYKTRLEELQIHEKILEEQKLLANEELSKLRMLLNSTLEISAKNLEETTLKNEDEFYKSIRTSKKLKSVVKDFKAKLTKLKENNFQLFLAFSDMMENSSKKIRSSSNLILKSIRLFKDNGNFNNEEAKIFIKTLTKINKTTEKSFSTIKKQIEKRETAFNETVNSELLLFTSNCLQVENEVKFNETFTKTVKKLKMNIFIETSNFNTHINSICQHLENFQDISTVENLTIHKFQSHFLQTTSKLDQLASNFSSNLTKCEKILFQANEDIRSLSQGIYIEVENEVCAIFEQLKKRFQENREEKIEKLLNAVRNARNSLFLFCSNTIRKYYSSVEEEFRMFIQEKLNFVKEISQNIETSYICLHEKLKIMFGHPKNVRFLNELETELDNLEARSKSDLFSAIKTIQEIAREKHEVVVKEREKFVDDFEQFLKVIDFFENFQKNAIGKEDDNVVILMRNELLDKLCEDVHVQVVEELIDSLLKYFSTLETECLERRQQFRETWRWDVETIKSLFTVKYDERKDKTL